MELNKIIDNVFWLSNGHKTLVTKNFVKGNSVYGERLINYKDYEYREWVPYRSKFSAAFYKGIKNVKLKEGDSVLYLGASSGTTVSHVSDIVSKEGKVFAVEISEEMGVHLVILSKLRKNIFPIIADANKIESYEKYLPMCDFIYQDIAQRNQVEIFIKNAKKFLKKGKQGILIVKAKSIDVTKSTQSTINEVTKQLQSIFRIEQILRLEPYQKEHALFLLTLK